MAKKDIQKIEGRSADELNRLLQDARVQLGKLEFQHANNALKNTSELGLVRKQIARILTALHTPQA